MLDNEGTVLFDADCGLCQWSSDLGARLDTRRRLAFRALQSVDLGSLSPGLTLDMARQELYFVRPDGWRCGGVHAVARTLRCLPGIFALAGMLLSLAPIAWLASPLYRLVARHRALISAWLGLPVCRAPSAPPDGRRYPSQGDGPARISSIAYTFITSSSTMGSTTK